MPHDNFPDHSELVKGDRVYSSNYPIGYTPSLFQAPIKYMAGKVQVVVYRRRAAIVEFDDGYRQVVKFKYLSKGEPPK